MALANETISVEYQRNAIDQLVADLELSEVVAKEAKNIQAQQSAEIARLKVALANETVKRENERTAEFEAFTVEGENERAAEFEASTVKGENERTAEFEASK